MRRTGTIFGTAMLVATIGVVVGTATTASAANIVVTTSDDVAADDGRCSLREAIVSANTNTRSGNASGECAAGGASDTITLDAGVTYSMIVLLPVLEGELTIEGAGATIVSSATSRVLQVDVGAVVEIRDLTLTHRWSTSGAIGRGLYNRGTATLRNVTITDNREVGRGGGIFNGDDFAGNEAVLLTIIDSTIDGNSTVPHSNDRSGGGIRNHTNATLVIRGSSVSENESADSGGGISNIGSMSITDSSIDANVADGDGGGIEDGPDSELLLEDSSVSDNFADSDGGGIVIRSNSGGPAPVRPITTIRRSEVSNNDASRGSGGGIFSERAILLEASTIGDNISESGDGGGIHLGSGDTSTVTGSEIVGNDAVDGGGIFVAGAARVDGTSIGDNTASGNGGGIVVTGSAEIDASTITDNDAASGGGIWDDGNMFVETTTIADNSASGNGGGIFTETGTMQRVTMSGNTAGTDGGGLFVRSNSGAQEVVVTNSTVSGNSAPGAGGGIQSYGKTLVSFTTITDNAASIGAGIASYHAQSDGVDLLASIVAGNRGGGLDVEHDDRPGPVVAGTTSSGYNVLGSVDDQFTLDERGDVSDVGDPQLNPLGRLGGGPTDSHRPLPTSLAVARVPKTVTDASANGIDQRGAPRATNLTLGSAGSHECICLAPFVSVQPVRLADSRDEPTIDGEFRDTGQRTGGTVWKIDVYPRRTAIGGSPGGAVFNVTALNAVEPGFATVYPCTDDVPNASSLNYVPGSVEPNEVIAKFSPDGEICIFTQSTVDIVVDLVAWIPVSSGYVPRDPARVADSRDLPTADGLFRNTGIRRSGTVWEIEVGGRGGIPGGAETVALNLTVSGSTGPGFATAYPCTDERPNASSINYDVGVTRPNELVTKLSPDSTLCVFVQTDVHVIVDVVGYLDNPVYAGIDPVRFADSRDEPTIDGRFRDTGIRDGGSEWEIQIGGRGGVPADFLQSVMVNVTVTEGTAPGFVTVYGCGSAPRPDTSSLNHAVGTTRPNELLVSVSFDGTICVYTQSATHVIVDVVGFVATRARYAG